MSYRYRGRIYTNLELTGSDGLIVNNTDGLILSNNDSMINHTGSGTLGITSMGNININSNEINIGNGSSIVKINGTVSSLTSTDYLAEGITNFYFTNQRAIDGVSGNINTNNVNEGTSNLYFTVERAIEAINSTSIEISNFPATQPISGTISVSNSSIDTNSKTLDGNGNPISSLQNEIETVRSLCVQVMNESPLEISIASIQENVELPVVGDFYPQNQTVNGFVGITGSVNVNTISGFSLESGGNLESIKTNSDKNKYIGDDIKAVISNTGFNVNNQITGFALESGGNLESIKTNSDKNKYVGDDIKAVISNTGFNCNNIATTPLITGFSTSTLQTEGNTLLNDIKTNSNKLNYDALGNLLVNIAIGGGGETTGTINIKDSNGANITATNGNLNTNITNTSLPVTGTFFQATQPVSIASSVPVTGTFFQETQPVSIASTVPVSIASSVPVTGTFFQETQPVSIASTVPVSIASTVPVSIASSVPVTGTFFQETQPVSIASTVPVSIASSVPVTGTFFQETQPVSIASTVPVSGTFFQATQPVSIASTVPVSIASTVPVSGTFFQETQPVSIASTVAVNDAIVKVGSLVNGANNVTLNPYGTGTWTTTLFNVSTYGTKSLIQYRDGNGASLTTIHIYGTTPTSSGISIHILTLVPTRINPSVVLRTAYSYVDLSPFQEIQAVNVSSETLTNVDITVLSG
jgi:hypothetical protein